MTDLISRADAIEAVCKVVCEDDVSIFPECDQIKYCDEIQALLALPSADADKLVRCEDCRYRNTWDNPRLEPQYYKCGMGVKFRDYGYVREDDYCPLGKRREE